MNDLSLERIEQLRQAVDVQIGESIRKKVLHTLAITGVASNQQLIQAAGLQRDKLRRTLEKMAAAASDYPPLFSIYNSKLKRGAEPGPSSRVYRLGESGAALCRADGLENTRPCQLEDARAVRHALGMLDVHLAARQAGLQVKTDRNLYYNDTDFIRPDNLVTLPDGKQVILESEQDANSDFLERIRRSLINKIDFFESDASADVLIEIRMLVDLPRGKFWQHTLSIWRHAIEITQEAYGADLPFRLLALPLGEFLDKPDWNGEPDPYRWTDLTSGDAGLILTKSEPLAKAALQMPAFSNLERRMVLAALLQHLRESSCLARQTHPDVEFLYLMRMIYLASHDPFAPALSRSGMPFESLYLLDQYLKMNPSLRQIVEGTTQMDARRIHWNQSTCLHRMQVVVDRFLEYHGWQSNGPLLAYSHTVDYQSRSPRRFSVSVEITNPEIMIAEEIAVMPGKQEIEFLEKSLTWVLTAIFAYTHHLGLKKPPFW